MSVSYKGIFVPEYTDAADGPEAFRLMVDSGPIPRFTNSSERDGAIPLPNTGVMCFVVDVGSLQYYTGSAWEDVRAGGVPGAHTHPASDITSGTMSVDRLPAGTTGGPGIVQLNTSVSSTSTEQAATPSAVKSAYDRAGHAHAYLPLGGGTITGELTVNGTLTTVNLFNAEDIEIWGHAKRHGTEDWDISGLKNVKITDSGATPTGGEPGDVVMIYNTGVSDGVWVKSSYGGASGWHKVA